ncbi:MAG: ABC transporter permease [Phycisphaerales bacterium]|nr:ABC transporter permease [Phycisphaerales bacterium]
MPETAVPQAISGVEAMRGIGAAEARGFWADAWQRVLRNRAAVLALSWIGLVGLFAVIAPFVANANPLILEELGPDGKTLSWSSPLWASLTASDFLMALGLVVGGLWLALPLRLPRGERLGALVVAAVIAMASTVLSAFASDWLDEPERAGWSRTLGDWVSDPKDLFRRVLLVGAIGLPFAAAALAVPFLLSPRARAVVVTVALIVAAIAAGSRWSPRPANYDQFVDREAAGSVRCIYTLIPWSPDRLRSELIIVPPLQTVGEAITAKETASVRESQRFAAALAAARASGNTDQTMRIEDDMAQVARQRASLKREWQPLLGSPFARHRFLLGTDPNGGDVLAQLLWACRLSISVGFVSTGIAVVIGVTMGSIMGYFGGTIDLILFRVVEIFMAVPVLFLLIVAAGVLPRSTYVMMAIIGCLSWTGAARFTRAEFMKLRHQDFVQGARAAGLPLRSVLFRHMLPNGVTPVLVDASFAIAGAIIAEATLSYLGLGPDNQASWGKLLSSATGTTGTFIWWLAIFPGAAIFVSVLSYNILGGALRDAIDPKLRKAAH